MLLWAGAARTMYVSSWTYPTISAPAAVTASATVGNWLSFTWTSQY
jgi:hypothetical protein